MIKFKTMKFDNCFSYGRNNVVNFDVNPITQLVGFNGHGKSSIAKILEIVCFNKCSQGTKINQIKNRYSKDNYSSIELGFEEEADEYYIAYRRTSTLVVKLTKNGEDISAHTATGTYKLIEDILGFDHKTFVQLIYQSSAQSLEFLTATDTNRKKFLIDLLNLEKYVEAFEKAKAITSEVQKEVTGLEGKITTISSWINKNSTLDFKELEVKPIVEAPVALVEERSRVTQELRVIDSTNKSIITNNTYGEILESIDLTPIVLPTGGSTVSLTKMKTEYEMSAREAATFLGKVAALKSNCPTCGHALDNSKQLELVDDKKNIKLIADQQVKILSDQISKINSENKILEDNASKIARWEQYNSLFNPTMKTEILDKNNLQARVIQLDKDILKQQELISSVTAHNQKASAHNSKIKVILEQMEDMDAELGKHKTDLFSVNSRLVRLQILQKTFSTNGLIAFKIESMIKDLEDLVNQYLAELSYGRFQLAFVINSEKLNVVITDDGIDIEISELSKGELARVNTATLLAIRKLMQQLSNTKVNLLILDETLENLDIDGKEKLVELLVKEEHLNTILISHSFSHPLLEKIHVIKENNFSRLE